MTSDGGCDGILSGGVCATERKRARGRRALAKAADGCKSTACHIKRDSFYEHTFFYSPSFLLLLLLKPLFMCLLSADILFRQGLAISAAVFFAVFRVFTNTVRRHCVDLSRFIDRSLCSNLLQIEKCQAKLRFATNINQIQTTKATKMLNCRSIINNNMTCVNRRRAKKKPENITM